MRLTTATLHQLAVNSTVRHPVEIPRPSAVQLVRMSCCDTGWGEVDHARCSHRTGGCGHVFDAQLWDAHRPARMCVDPRSLGWCTPKTGSNCGHWTDCATNLAGRAGQTEKPRLCVGVGVRRSGEVSGLNGDRQGRGRSPPARVCPALRSTESGTKWGRLRGQGLVDLVCWVNPAAAGQAYRAKHAAHHDHVLILVSLHRGCRIGHPYKAAWAN
jgi:hypothetical protein